MIAVIGLKSSGKNTFIKFDDNIEFKNNDIIMEQGWRGALQVFVVILLYYIF